MKINEEKFNVRFAETDLMGVAHHSNFFIWFEMGRINTCKRILKHSFPLLVSGSMMAPVVQSACRHYTYVRFEDELFLITKLKEANSPKLVFYYELRNYRSKKLVAIGKTTHVLVDSQLEMVLNIPTELQKDLETIKKEYEYILTDGMKYEKCFHAV